MDCYFIALPLLYQVYHAKLNPNYSIMESERAMKINRVKQLMSKNQIAFGTYVSIADPKIVELIGVAGFDAAFIDMEHTTFSLEQVENMIRACEVTGITSIIRTPGNDPHLMLRLLDAGAQGIQVPHVRNRKEAIQVRDASRYAPLGTRGALSTSRAAKYGAVSWRNHTETSNENILLSLMIEDKEGLEHLEDIASVDGIDLIAMGPSDLSESLGLTEPNHPELWKEIGKIATVLKNLGKAKLALTHGHPTLTADISQLMKWNVGYSNVQPDIVKLIRQHYSDKLIELRSKTSQP